MHTDARYTLYGGFGFGAGMVAIGLSCSCAALKITGFSFMFIGALLALVFDEYLPAPENDPHPDA